MTDFNSFGLAAPILQAIEGEGYATPTPIQAQAIPAVMRGADLLGIAQTGTGKTAAFALPILHRLAETRRPAPRRGCRALVLSPTRELASQIAESFKTYGRHLGLSVGVVFGGVGHRPQIQALTRGLDVLVATPGRLLDHVGERAVGFEATEIFVLDEADQMLDLGFVKPIRRIVGMLPACRQNLFFSATMPREIAGLADELLRDPVKIAVTPVARTADRVSQSVRHVHRDMKRNVLVDLLADPAMARTLVFTRTKRGADRVARHLTGAGIDAAAIHGNKSQRQREEALEAFREGHTRVLVATDIAARGIDIDNVSHVVNFELPEVPETYVHRIGRTARAGAEGQAISLCDREERELLRAIERLTRLTIPVVGEPVAAAGGEAPAASERRHASPRHEGRRGDAPRRDERRAERGHDRNRDHRPSRDRQGEGRDHVPRGEGHPHRARRDGEGHGVARPARAERSNHPRPARPDGERRDGHRGERHDSHREERRERHPAERRHGDRPASPAHAAHRGQGTGERREGHGEGRREHHPRERHPGDRPAASSRDGHPGRGHGDRRNAGDRGRPRPTGAAEGKLDRMSWMKPRSAAH